MSSKHTINTELRLLTDYNSTDNYRLSIGFTDVELIGDIVPIGTALLTDVLNKFFERKSQHWVLIFEKIIDDDNKYMVCGFELQRGNKDVISYNIFYDFKSNPKYGLHHIFEGDVNPYEYFLENFKDHQMNGTKYTARDNNCQKYLQTTKTLYPSIKDIKSVHDDWLVWVGASKLDSSRSAQQAIYSLAEYCNKMSNE